MDYDGQKCPLFRYLQDELGCGNTARVGVTYPFKVEITGSNPVGGTQNLSLFSRPQLLSFPIVTAILTATPPRVAYPSTLRKVFEMGFDSRLLESHSSGGRRRMD